MESAGLQLSEGEDHFVMMGCAFLLDGAKVRCVHDARDLAANSKNTVHPVYFITPYKDYLNTDIHYNYSFT